MLRVNVGKWWSIQIIVYWGSSNPVKSSERASLSNVWLCGDDPWLALRGAATHRWLIMGGGREAGNLRGTLVNRLPVVTSQGSFGIRLKWCQQWLWASSTEIQTVAIKSTRGRLFAFSLFFHFKILYTIFGGRGLFFYLFVLGWTFTGSNNYPWMK